MTIVQATEITALVIGIGGVLAVLGKGFQMARRLARLMDGFLGDGSKDHPGVVAGQAELVGAMKGLKDQASVDLSEIRADLAAVKEDVAAVKRQTGAIEQKLDDHVDTVAPSLLADGQAWGARLEAKAADNARRIDALEQK